MSNTSWVKQPEKCTEKSLLRSRLSFLFSVPRASTKSMQKIHLGSRIPPVASLIPLPWRDFEHLFATVLHCNLFKRNTRDFFGFFSSQILFLLIWNVYIADNQLNVEHIQNKKRALCLFFDTIDLECNCPGPNYFRSV